jgi:hypothetical protein
MKNIFSAILTFTVLVLIQGCYTEHKVETTHKVELEVKPMHITIDINVKVDKALDDFFDDIDSQDKTMTDVSEENKEKSQSQKKEKDNE